MHNTRIPESSKANAQQGGTSGISGLSGLTPHQQMQHKELHLWQQTIHVSLAQLVNLNQPDVRKLGKYDTFGYQKTGGQVWKIEAGFMLV